MTETNINIEEMQKKGQEVYNRLVASSLVNYYMQVVRFNHKAGNKLNQTLLSAEDQENEINMIQEELDELSLAFNGFYMKKTDNGKVKTPFDSISQQREAIADAIGDIIYVTMGTAAKHGMDLAGILYEVSHSNNTKYTEDDNGNLNLVKNEVGKIQKGPNFQEPDLSFVEKPIDFNTVMETENV